MASENVLELTEANFDQVISEATEPVLVDFWAPWCGPCKMLAPLIDQIADEKKGEVKVGKVNVDNDNAKSIAQKFGIQAIPTMIIFRNGEVKQKVTGLTSKADLLSKISAA
ncbi:MAG: thioredoxin [Chthoniobacterales bacterium]